MIIYNIVRKCIYYALRELYVHTGENLTKRILDSERIILEVIGWKKG